ncbi:HPr family phosphocarrier protein [Gracilibacillus oryzae]|uniref:HPr family phosphocarrier protein n=1 Tax=Gracilibacillus oryzae TaxID=1672701 RepID=A0A7C8GVA5_9BACI|nr:HPr family phosphocarrier protein [Gracilibacillus oryzae]KAB8138200.1 HPr family phosphocarrier protein [Gracilibacillus oryzae]
MYVKDLKVTRYLGSKDIAALTNLARNYESDIKLQCRHYKIDVKSILGLLALSLDKGTEITIITKGDDDKEALQAICEFLQTDA